MPPPARFALALASAAAAGLLAWACSPKPTERSTDHPDVLDEYEAPARDAGAYAPPAGGFTPEVVLGAAGDAGGLTALPKGLAVSVLDDYLERLGDVPRARGLLPDLRLVREEITSGIIDRGDVGAALRRLGRGTRQVAGDGSPYKALASALTLAGEQLGGRVDDLPAIDEAPGNRVGNGR